MNSYIAQDGETEFCLMYCEDVAKKIIEMKVDIGIPELDLKITKEPIIAEMRKLKNE